MALPFHPFKPFFGNYNWSHEWKKSSIRHRNWRDCGDESLVPWTVRKHRWQALCIYFRIGISATMTYFIGTSRKKRLWLSNLDRLKTTLGFCGLSTWLKSTILGQTSTELIIPSWRHINGHWVTRLYRLKEVQQNTVRKVPQLFQNRWGRKVPFYSGNHPLLNLVY